MGKRLKKLFESYTNFTVFITVMVMLHFSDFKCVGDFKMTVNNFGLAMNLLQIVPSFVK